MSVSIERWQRRWVRRRGASLVDFLLYLTLVAVVVAGAVLAYNNVDNRQKRLQTAQLVNEIFAGVSDLHRGGATYGTANLIPTLEAAKMVPSRGRRVNNNTVTINTPFDDNVTVVGAGNTFVITVVDMSEANCIDLVSNYADQDPEESSLAEIEIDSTELPMPATVAAIATACDDGDDVALTFR